jgi:maleylacetoacetate isomerase
MLQNIEITLYHYWRSSSSWRVRLACAYKNIKVNYVHIDLLKGENEAYDYLSKNPFGYVPTIEIQGRILTESVAIIELLEELKPTPSLYPGDAFNRALIRSLCEMINAGVQPLQNPNTVDRYAEDLPCNEQKRLEWIQFFINRWLFAFEKKLQDCAGTYCVGNTITASDLFLVPQIYSALRFKVDISKYPICQRIYNYLLNLDFVKSTHPEVFAPK